MESDGDRGRLEAVVIATGPTMVRLVTRSGRRITFPTSRWDSTWTLVGGPPPVPQQCHCQQTAFFRHTVGGETVWVCEDHVPHGARAYFPGDTPGPAMLGLSCPRCDSTDVEVSPVLVLLSDARSTTRCSCRSCQCSWSPLVGRGLGDDGSVLAADIAQLIRGPLPVSEVWLGFVAYRALCRDIGMGNVGHVQGVPVLSMPSLAAALSIVLFGEPTPARPDVVGERPPPFGCQFPSTDVLIGSLWKRRSTGWNRDVTCRVVGPDNSRNVTFRLTSPDDGGPAMTLSLADFHLYWTPNGGLTERPRTWSVWRHIETDQLVQVVLGTSTQTANNQVSYVTPDGRLETTPIVTFYRLHRELPTPPDGHIWHREGRLFEAESRDGQVTVHPYAVHEESRQARAHSFSAADFFRVHEPLVFEDELVSYYPEALIQRDARWQRRSYPSVSALVIDIGRAGHGNDFVRLNDDTGFHVKELLQFLAEFEPLPCSVPCEVGDTWVDIDVPEREGVIDRVDAVRGSVVIRFESETTSLSFSALVARFRKLDVRSYWEILDSEDDS